MCRLLVIEFTQHLDSGDLSPLGWAVAVAYLLGSVFCVRAAMVTQQPERGHADKQPPWWGLAAILLFLGINKWLDLQTLLMGLGRTVSGTGGWYQHRRAVEAVFAVLFTLGVLAAAIACLTKWGWFFRQQPGVCAGVALLLLFIIIRDATINHVDKLLHVNLHGNYWSWILELLATACFAWSAAHTNA